MDVSLVEITKENLFEVLALEVTAEQRGYVSANAKSIAEAHFEPRAWFRAIAAGDELVGFAMVYIDPDESEFYIWRFMVDGRHQGHGYGRRAAELLLEKARAEGYREVVLNTWPGEHSALGFWQRLGFEDTGELHDGEMFLRLVFVEPA